LAMVGLEGLCQYQARMTFAIARHALVDLSQVFSAAPENNSSVNRLPPSDLLQIRQQLRDVGFVLNHDDGGDSELQRLRGLYEPYAVALAQYLALDLPPWIKDDRPKDNWQTSAWQQQYSQQPRPVSVQDDHY
ncbi:MAG: two pore domain potassium channel family protein, partial [Candidatus Angelobacter sp.]